MLTDNGLGMIAADNPDLTTFLVESTQRGDKTGPVFYAAEELGEEVFFGSDNGKVWRYHKKDGKFLLLQLNIPSRIVALKKLNERELLIATATDGVFIYQSSTGSLEHYTTPGLTGQPVHSAYMDKYSEVWFEQYTSGTIIHFNPSTRTFKTEHIAVEPTSTDRSRPAFHVHEDIYGTVWVHPYGGGFSYFDREHNRLLPFYNSLTGNDWRFSNKIHSAFSDRQGNLWMCTHSKGLEKITFRPSQFNLITPVPHRYESLSNEVRGLCEDNEHNLWVGLKDGKLRVYDKNRKERGYLTEAGTISHTGVPMRGNVYFIMQDLSLIHISEPTRH